MSLPPALAARLARRGLIKDQNLNQENNDKTQTVAEEQHEEVIAEDYDDAPKPEIVKSKIIDTVLGCPNKYNIHHNCTNYCARRYGDVGEKPSKKIRKQLARLLKMYPIKDPVWEQVYDPGLQTYYFWNTDTDQVSWLPPNHPEAKISVSAEKLRRLIRDDQDEESSSDKDEEPDDDKNNEDHDDDDDEDDDDDDDDDDESEDSDSDSDSASENHSKFKRMRTLASRNQLDPMDPASYSDIPRGKWSDGLNKKD